MTATSVITLGETMALFRAAHVGSLTTEADFRLSVGGAESNVAIAVARLGVDSTWVGRVGDDRLGERILRDLRAEGVHARAIVDSDAPTALMVKEQRGGGSTRVLYYRAGSAGSRLCPEDLEGVNMSGSCVLHVTGITAGLSESAHETVFAAVELAREAGAPISFDVNHRPAVWGDRDPVVTYQRLAAHSTLFFAGEDEARLVTPGVVDPVAMASAIADLGPSHVVIKLGERGCYALIDGTPYWQDAVPVNVLDTVGAGDAFVGGYLAEYARGSDPNTALRNAVKNGALACLNAGDWEGSGTRRDLLTMENLDPVER